MKRISVIMLMLSMMITTAVATEKKTVQVTADARLYLQKVELTNKKALARGQQVRKKEAKLFVACAPKADVKAIAAQLKAIGAHPQGIVGRYIMVSTPTEVVDQIAAIEGVTCISKGPNVGKKTNVSRTVTGVDKVQNGEELLPQAFTGKDVVVGVIDGGFDFTHPAFQDEEGNLRIKALYCAAVTPDEDDEPVVTLDGTELAGAVTIDADDIMGVQTDSDSNSHGTHCAATAAGTLLYSYGGMAPEADIVLCPFKMGEDDDDDDDDEVDIENSERSYNIIQSIMFIRDYAQRQGKPYIVSMSLNTQNGTHDGTSLMASMLDELVSENTNMVLASGNEGGSNCYVDHQYATNDTLHVVADVDVHAHAFTRQPGELSFQIGLYNYVENKEVWRSMPIYSADGNQVLGIYVTEDEGAQELSNGIDDEIAEDIYENVTPLFENGGLVLTVGKLEDGRTTASLETQNCLYPIAFTLHVAAAEGSEVDMWGDNGTSFWTPMGSNYYSKGVPTMSMGDWGTGGSIITVGSWMARNSITNIFGMEEQEGSDSDVNKYSEFSSYGTDMAGHNHPFISAPGTLVVSALNSFDESGEFDDAIVKMDEDFFSWGFMSGTSMATPTTAGIIALWLEAKPDLTYEEIKQVMAASATTDEWTEAEPIHYGYGKIDAYKGLLNVLNITTAIPSLSQHQPKGIAFRLAGDVLFADGADDGLPVTIYTTSGVLVRQTTVQSGNVSLAGLTKGVYALQLGKLGSTLIRK